MLLVMYTIGVVHSIVPHVHFKALGKAEVVSSDGGHLHIKNTAKSQMVYYHSHGHERCNESDVRESQTSCSESGFDEHSGHAPVHACHYSKWERVTLPKLKIDVSPFVDFPKFENYPPIVVGTYNRSSAILYNARLVSSSLLRAPPSIG